MDIPGLPHASAEPESGSSGDRRPGGTAGDRRPTVHIRYFVTLLANIFIVSDNLISTVCSYLILHERDQWRHDDGDAAIALGVEVGRHLVHQALPGASRQQD